MKFVLGIAFVFFNFYLKANIDSLLYTRDFIFNEGIYLNFSQFRNNDPIPLSAINSNYDKNDKEFLLKVLAHNSFNYKDSSGKEIKVNTNNVWGYSINKSIFVKTINTFSKVQIIGSLCHFIGVFESFTSIPDPYYGNNSTQVSYRSEQAVIDMQNGNISEFTAKLLEKILERDPPLHEQFMALKPKKRRMSVFIFLKKYNEAHPLYIKRSN